MRFLRQRLHRQTAIQDLAHRIDHARLQDDIWSARHQPEGAVAVAMRGPISGLRNSDTYRLAAEIYQRHRDTGSGVCVLCGGGVPCPPRQHAAIVIQACEDPSRCDDQPSTDLRHRKDPGGWQEQNQPDNVEFSQAVSPTVTGYSLGGLNRRKDVPHFDYER